MEAQTRGHLNKCKVCLSFFINFLSQFSNLSKQMASFQCDIDWQSTKNTILERNSHMFNNSDMSDISFTCEGSDNILYAHKYVLGTSSAVFHAMFYGDLAEKNSIIHLCDTDEKSLEEFLKFLYTDECNLTTDNVISVMYLSKKYIVPSLTKECVDFLERGLDPENVLTILEQAIYFDEKDFEMKCWKVVDRHLKEILTLDNFLNIHQETLASVLKRSSLIIKEIELFKAVLKWIEFQCLENGLELTIVNRRSVIGEAVYDLRFLAVSEEMFSKYVVDSGLLTYEEFEAIQEKIKGVDIPGLQWQLGVRKQNYEMLAFKRFRSWKAEGWEYNGEADCVCFSVDREVLFHGVRLFGDLWENQYKVIFRIEDVKVKGTYKSKKMSDGLAGYCVMLDLPVVIKQNKVVKMSALIRGPPSGYGINKIAPVKVEGVTVTFHDADSPTNDTWTNKGQFHKIILSI